MILTIVTISIEYPSREFDRTINSILDQSNTNLNFCAVISRISEESLIKLKCLLDNLFLSSNIIANRDLSLYNAMNIALDANPDSPILFLNAGDVFYAKSSVDLIYSKYRVNFVNAFSVGNRFGTSNIYCRFSNPKSYKKSLAFKIRNLFSFRPLENRLPPHQGIVAVYQDKNMKPLRFSETSGYSADSALLRLLVQQDVVYHDDVISLFDLGGVSSRPSMTRLKSYYRRSMYLKLLIEPFLVLAYLVSPEVFFMITNRFAGNPSCALLPEKS
jgi:hypothetical protein